jgi:multidrug efflux pump subunit AcrA (membrane-fusion protein)
MIFQLANRSSHALPTRTSQLLRRHQSTASAPATPAQSLQAQQLQAQQLQAQQLQAQQLQAQQLQARQRQQLIAQQILLQQLQAQQQSPVAEIAKHPSAVSHPALSDQPAQRGGGDNSIVFIFGGLLLGGIPLSYWYWSYRERAMRQKKEEMLRGIQERYAARHGGG